MAWRSPTDAIATRRHVQRGAAAVLRKAWECVWWLVRAHVADVHLLPRGEALEPPPARWLEGWPSAPDRIAASRRAPARACRDPSASPAKPVATRPSDRSA
jgi:hypothetical protein